MLAQHKDGNIKFLGWETKKVMQKMPKKVFSSLNITNYYKKASELRSMEELDKHIEKIMKKLLRYNKDEEFVFIDCETFNLCLNFAHNLPWQISMIKVKGDEVVAFKDFYIKWDTHLKIGEEAARITRYSQKKMDQKGVAPENVYPTIKDWLDNADHIVGHNILGFDIYLIKGLYEYMNDDYKPLVKKID